MKNSAYTRTGIFVVLISLALIYFACDDSGVSTPVVTQYCFNAKISGWVSGNGHRILTAQVQSSAGNIYSFANCSVDTAGNFSICFPDLAETTLFSSDSIFYSGCQSGYVNFSPPDVKGATLFNFRVYQDSAIVGSVDNHNYTDSAAAGDFEIGFVYTDKLVNVSGTKVCGNDTLQFYGTASKGWTKYIKHYLRVEPGSKTVLYDNNEPAGTKWRYHGS